MTSSGARDAIANTATPVGEAKVSRSPLSHWWLLVYFLPAPLAVIVLAGDQGRWWELPLRDLALMILHTAFIGGIIHALYEWVVGPRLSGKPLAVRIAAHAITIELAVIVGLTAALPIANTIRPLSERNFVFDIFLASVLSGAYVGGALTVQMLHGRAQASEQRANREREARARAEVRALQARTNSHFLFNALNALSGHIRTDPELAETLTLGMARLMRYSLDAARHRRVPLKRELDAVRDYLNVEGARYGPRLRYDFDVDPAANDALVPPMSVQPLVENAILHGVGGGLKEGEVWVTASVRNDRLRIEVIDDGPGPGRSTHTGSATSLTDLRERLELLYGGRASFSLASRDPRGSKATLDLPHEQEED